MTEDSRAPGPGARVVELAVDGATYRLCLPHWETDYIQAKIVEARVPYEHGMLRSMAARLAPGDLVLDVGANVGNHSLYLAAVAGASVHAFEPNEALAAAMRESVALNEMTDRVVVHAAAVGREPGAGVFHESLPQNLGAQVVRVVGETQGDFPVLALDSVPLPGRVACLKVDVEGMELAVLEGARRILSEDQPLAYVEVGSETNYAAVADLLSACGYCYWMTYNATPTHLFVPVSTVSVEDRLNRILDLLGHDSYRAQESVRNRRRVEAIAKSGAATEAALRTLRADLRRAR